jgi:hypothetical protein
LSIVELVLSGSHSARRQSIPISHYGPRQDAGLSSHAPVPLQPPEHIFITGSG